MIFAIFLFWLLAQWLLLLVPFFIEWQLSFVANNSMTEIIISLKQISQVVSYLYIQPLLATVLLTGLFVWLQFPVYEVLTLGVKFLQKVL